MIETTFAIIKGDAVRRGLVGRIISRFEDKSLRIVAMKMVRVSEKQAFDLYDEHVGKSFFQRLVAFTVGTPVVVMAIMGNSAVSVVRQMLGATDCVAAQPGTIRGDFGASSSNRTLVHASRTLEDAEREVGIFFKLDEYPGSYARCDWDCSLEPEVEHR
jgi:nucleoside-diphosphate kinase